MSLLSFEYFTVIAEELNFSKAAARLYVSQQSLSQHVAKLEKRFQVKLLERTTPLKLTHAGEVFYRFAVQMVKLHQQLTEEMRKIHDGSTGVIHIGMTYNRSRFLLPQILISFKKLFPDIEIICQGDSPMVLEQKLLNKQLDFVFYATSLKQNKQIEFIDIKIDPIVMIIEDSVLRNYCPDQYETIISRARQGVRLEAVRNCPMLMYPAETHTRRALDKLFADMGTVPNIVMQSENVETLFTLATMGMGISFCPEMYLPVLSVNVPKHFNVHYILLNEPSTYSRMCIAYRKDRHLSKADERFILLIREMFQQKRFDQAQSDIR